MFKRGFLWMWKLFVIVTATNRKNYFCLKKNLRWTWWCILMLVSYLLLCSSTREVSSRFAFNLADPLFFIVLSTAQILTQLSIILGKTSAWTELMKIMCLGIKYQWQTHLASKKNTYSVFWESEQHTVLLKKCIHIPSWKHQRKIGSVSQKLLRFIRSLKRKNGISKSLDNPIHIVLCRITAPVTLTTAWKMMKNIILNMYIIAPLMKNSWKRCKILKIFEWNLTSGDNCEKQLRYSDGTLCRNEILSCEITFWAPIQFRISWNSVWISLLCSHSLWKAMLLDFIVFT